MTPDEDDLGGGILQPLKRLLGFVLALAFGVIIGEFAGTLPDYLFSYFSGADRLLYFPSVVNLMLNCLVSWSMPLFLALAVLALVNWRLFWVLAGTLAAGAVATLNRHPRFQDAVALVILLGITALGFWWFRLFAKSREARRAAEPALDPGAGETGEEQD